MAFKDIQILRMNYLRGPNIWTYRPIIEALIDLGEMEDHPSNKIEGFNDRINGWLPGLVEHHCGVGHRGALGNRSLAFLDRAARNDVLRRADVCLGDRAGFDVETIHAGRLPAGRRNRWGSRLSPLPAACRR